MGEPVRREPRRVRLLLQGEYDGLAAAIGPLDEQRRVECPEAVAETFLELLLAHGDDAHVVVGPRCLIGGEERQGVARVVDDQVLEVVVVAVGHRLIGVPPCTFAHRAAV